MNNTFLPTNITATTTATNLADLLTDAGVDIGTAVTTQNGYIKNNSATIALNIGQGSTAPDDFATLAPLASVIFNAGMNTNEVWLKSASSTVSVDFCEGGILAPARIDGVIGTITVTDETVPVADADGNLVDSSITDDGSTVTVANDFAVTGTVEATSSIQSTGGGIGYATGAGGAVTQGTSRTTTVVCNAVCGAITLVSAAGSATPFSFTVTNSTVAATDTIHLSQKSGTDIYTTQVVSAVGAGSFRITLANASGTTTEQPVFNFAVIKAVAA